MPSSVLIFGAFHCAQWTVRGKERKRTTENITDWTTNAVLDISEFVMICEYYFLKRHSAGDTKVPFCLQSCVKPLEYAIAVHEHETEHVHQFVGKEPSGLKFNMLSLDDEGWHKINATSVLIITECSCTRNANITNY